MLRSLFALVALSHAAAWQLSGVSLAPCGRRVIAPTMQFGGRKPGAKPKKRGGSSFYDDENDTVTQEQWQPSFVENGDVDLANVGGIYYVALLPFLFFFVAYVSGAFNFGYGKGARADPSASPPPVCRTPWLTRPHRAQVTFNPRARCAL